MSWRIGLRPVSMALYDKLINGLEVFFFPGAQEVLAGTDGLESMRAPFRHQSRLNVVLYRPKWGNTSWTAAEELAIKESCLDNSFRNIFVYVIENTGVLPKWLPDTHVSFTNQISSESMSELRLFPCASRRKERVTLSVGRRCNTKLRPQRFGTQYRMTGFVM